MAKKKKEKTSKEEVSLQDLQTQVVDLDREIFAMRNELAIHRKLEKPHLIKLKRKEKGSFINFNDAKTTLYF